MEIYEGRTHVGELMSENGDIWRNMERYERIEWCAKIVWKLCVKIVRV